MKNFDVIVIGAGSTGVPCAMFLAEAKLKTLVIDLMPSVGQGQNKTAIGGIRATHSDGSKIKTCLESITIFRDWRRLEGDDIGWQEGGYTFPAYREGDETLLKNTLAVQKKFGLDIDWIDSAAVRKIVPGINPENLRGATYSPHDGNASPLLAINAFFRKSVKLGAAYRFNEKVVQILIENGSIKGVKTNKDTYQAPFVVNAAGAGAAQIGAMAGVNLPVVCDSHEGGITEPVEKFFAPMVVDMRPGKSSKNIYFYQNDEGQIVFCLTPEPIIIGTDRRSTSLFLPLIAERMIALIPRLANIKVRRVWRGLYPMTPDGFPIVDAAGQPKGFIIAAGFCGQGFMLGPGVGKLVQKLVTGSLSQDDRQTLEGFRLRRQFAGMEVFK
ncbi:MAG: FAD-binding oxidoreductase [Elusimicrobia bacterium]|nr:FAD-binding oxidoreductase [Elusimicrobiota bacterium]